VLTLSTVAESTALTTVQAVKDRLAITTTTEDDYLTDQIDRATAAICTYLNVAPTTNGARTLGSETLVETFRFGNAYSANLPFNNDLLLARGPVTSITSVVVDGTTLDPTEYEVDGLTGCLHRLTTSDVFTPWYGRKIVVTYVAGWALPDDDDRTLPFDIEDAAIELVKANRFGRARDPLLRSENILESLYSYSLFAPGDTPDVFPPSVTAKLAPYRFYRI
jgi:hypothetical protein